MEYELIPGLNIVTGCDAKLPSIYRIGSDSDGNPMYVCRCTICSRCNHHTGNSHQGHYWSYCKVTKSLREHHFCCPDNCELEEDHESKNMPLVSS